MNDSLILLFGCSLYRLLLLNLFYLQPYEVTLNSVWKMLQQADDDELYS